MTTDSILLGSHLRSLVRLARIFKQNVFHLGPLNRYYFIPKNSAVLADDVCYSIEIEVHDLQDVYALDIAFESKFIA